MESKTYENVIEYILFNFDNEYDTVSSLYKILISLENLSYNEKEKHFKSIKNIKDLFSEYNYYDDSFSKFKLNDIQRQKIKKLLESTLPVIGDNNFIKYGSVLIRDPAFVGMGNSDLVLFNVYDLINNLSVSCTNLQIKKSIIYYIKINNDTNDRIFQDVKNCLIKHNWNIEENNFTDVFDTDNLISDLQKISNYEPKKNEFNNSTSDFYDSKDFISKNEFNNSTSDFYDSKDFISKNDIEKLSDEKLKKMRIK